MNNAVLMFEAFEPVIEAARGVVANIGYPSVALDKLKRKIKAYDKACEKWLESRERTTSS